MSKLSQAYCYLLTVHLQNILRILEQDRKKAYNNLVIIRVSVKNTWYIHLCLPLYSQEEGSVFFYTCLKCIILLKHMHAKI